MRIVLRTIINKNILLFYEQIPPIFLIPGVIATTSEKIHQFELDNSFD